MCLWHFPVRHVGQDNACSWFIPLLDEYLDKAFNRQDAPALWEAKHGKQTFILNDKQIVILNDKQIVTDIHTHSRPHARVGSIH